MIIDKARSRQMRDNMKMDERYKNFTFLEDPVPFDKLFDGKDYNLVQLHDVSNYGSEDEPVVVGFVGAFKWIAGIISPLDGDTYFKDMEVLGYHEFNCEGEIALDILVEDW